ncbi:rh blood group, D antigen [Electrophorus electricus]|uniref:Ammonium transporter AmtB-like domain-containing protein n=1 Tax=Electrophorus electricus TaxID=8005 RepID=A0A4W4FW56_ELEEL|nr:rh blood group, D antigen [Electrophorus electricus]
MAPHYAPSLWARLPAMALMLEIIFIVLFAFFVETEEFKKTKNQEFLYLYANFQDVHVIVFLGFGFMSMFLVRYGFSGTGFGLLVAAMVVQWATFINAFLSSFHSSHFKWPVQINLNSLVNAELCAASALVAMGAVHGKTNPAQLLLLGLLEVTGLVVNQGLIKKLFKNDTFNTTMQLHVFGALFGVMTSWVLYRSEAEPRHEKEKFDSKTGLFSTLGMLLLWMFWPSINFVEAQEIRIMYSTYLSLAVSAVTAMALSVLLSPKGKINLVHVQGAALAGGVAIGAIRTVLDPWVAMVIGMCATLLSTLGFRYMKDHMLFAFECHDTCGVLSVHAIPGILGWFADLFLQLVNTDDATIAIRFAVHYICILLISVSMSLVTGTITGFLLKLKFWKPQQDRKCFDDQAFWEFPHLAVHN